MYWHKLTILVIFELALCQGIYNILVNKGRFTGYTGHVLNVPSLAEYSDTSLLRCAVRCAKHVECLSFNYYKISRVCSLTKLTQSTNPQDYTADTSSTYWGEWEPDLTTVAPTTLLVTTPDVDECLTTPCDINAACSNMPGTFECTCNVGYTGNGLTCADDDECLTSPCDTNAACNNTLGGFECACNAGFSGDGLSCTGCADKLGMEDGTITDNKISASLSDPAHPAANGRLNGPDAWIAEPGNFDPQWIQVSLGYWTYVTGFITQGDNDGNWITKFNVKTFEESGIVFVTDQAGNTITIPGNSDSNTAATFMFPEPRFARGVRIMCLAPISEKFTLRFEILGCLV